MCDIQEAPARVKDMMDKIRKPSGSDRFDDTHTHTHTHTHIGLIILLHVHMCVYIYIYMYMGRFEKYELQLNQDFELIDETKILKVTLNPKP
jgi:hypothetical protein